MVIGPIIKENSENVLTHISFSGVEIGDIVRIDGKLCFITGIERANCLSSFEIYRYVSEYKEHDKIDTYTGGFGQVEVISRYFYPNAYDRILIFKSGRWFADCVSAYNKRFIWTVGHGRISFKNAVPYTIDTRKLYSTDKKIRENLFHTYLSECHFINNITEIKKKFKNK